MADITSHPPSWRRAGRRRTLEFRFYFALIFMIALPTSVVGWLRDILLRRTSHPADPFTRAWREADCVTPLIFSV